MQVARGAAPLAPSSALSPEGQQASEPAALICKNQIFWFAGLQGFTKNVWFLPRCCRPRALAALRTWPMLLLRPELGPAERGVGTVGRPSDGLWASPLLAAGVPPAVHAGWVASQGP